MASTELERASLHDWDTEQIRLTAFLASGTTTKPDNWWQEVVGSPPDTSTARPKVEELIQIGAAIGGQLTMRANPTRVDWLLKPLTSSPDEDPAEMIGRFDVLQAKFSEVIDRWLQMGPVLSRIAFGPIVLLPVNNVAEGYRRLVPYLPGVMIDPENMSDLIYRVNRSRKSNEIENLVINRLCGWSVGTVELRHLSVAPGQTTMLEKVGEPSYSCRAELDVNTSVAYSGSFDPEQAVTVWHELTKLGVEIIEKGDIP